MKVQVFILMALLIAAPIGATDRLAIRVSPAVAFEPANLIVRTTIQADKANRLMTVVAESSDFYGSSEIQLDGDRAPHTIVLEFRSVPSGDYQVRATLMGDKGQEVGFAQSHT